MIAYTYITIALLLYPLIAWQFVRLTKDLPGVLTTVTLILTTVSITTVVFIRTEIITTSEHFNWFFATLIYLTVAISLCLIQDKTKKLLQKISTVLLFTIFGAGCFSATFGFIFILMLSSDISTDQNILLSDHIIYKEWNIGQGPDPSIRLKKIKVYKKFKWLPVFAKQIKNKIYDEWNHPLQKNLNVTLSQDKTMILLKSHVEGYRVWNWSDAISIK